MMDFFIGKQNEIIKWISNLSTKTKFFVISALGLIFFLVLLKLNIMFPICNDDYVYLYIWSTSDRVMSIKDVVYSQYLHYQTWGGRFVAHFIVQSLLMIPPLLADILNSLVYILYSFLIYFHIVGKKKEISISLFCLIFFLVWLFQPAYGETILWITGSGNYLWCTTLILLFLLPYRLYSGQYLTKLKQFSYSVLFFILGILAGCTNENTGVATILILMFFFYLYKKRGDNIHFWMIFGFVGFLVGYTVLMVAPGNFVRFTDQKEEHIELLLYVFKIKDYSYRLFQHIGYLLIPTIFLFILDIYSKKNDKVIFFSNVIIYTIGIFIPVYAMLPVSGFPDRAYFFTVTCSIILFGIVYDRLDINSSISRCLKVFILALFFLAFSFDFTSSYRKLNINGLQWKERQQAIIEAENEGVILVSVYPINANGRFTQGDNFGSGTFMYRFYPIKFIPKE